MQGQRTRTFFTSDLHLGHQLVSDMRGFTTTGSHDEALAQRWDAAINRNDAVWVLGDISGGGRGSQLAALDWLSQRPGKKHLVSGNHDTVHPMHLTAHTVLPDYLRVFETVQSAARRQIAKRNCLLSHFPYTTNALVDRRDFSQWQLPDRGDWLLHGHIHRDVQQVGHQIHVGLDAWGLAPVLLDTIANMLTHDEF